MQRINMQNYSIENNNNKYTLNKMKKALLSLLLAIVSLPVAFCQDYDGWHIETTNVTACGSYTWSVNHETYTRDTGVVVMDDTVLYVLALTMSEGVVDTVTPLEMSGNCNVKWNKKLWKIAGTYIDTIHTESGCDTVKKITVTLSMRDSSKVINKVACDSFYTAWDSVLYTSFDDTLDFVTPEGCVRHDTLKLTMYHSYVAPMETADTTCSYRWRNRTITDTLIHYDTLQTVKGHCDSILSIKVNLSNHININIDTTVCDRYMSPWNEAYTADTTMAHSDTAGNCITTHNLTLVVNNSFNDTAYARANVRDVTAGCFFVWGDSTLTDTNQLIHLATLPNATVGHCDSLAAIRIIAYTHINHDTAVVTACGDENYRYTWRNAPRNAGTYVDSTFDSAANCMNYYHLDLTITATKDTLVSPSRNCEFVKFKPRYGNVFNTDGSLRPAKEYKFSLADTVAATNITFVDATEYNTNSQETYHTNVYTFEINPSDSVYHIHPNSKCRVNYNLTLTIKKPIELNRAAADDTVACDRFSYHLGTSDFVFDTTNGVSYDTTLYVHAGSQRAYSTCRDSIGHLILTLKHSTFEDTTVVACDSYLWPFNDSVYSVSGNIARNLRDTAGNNVLNADGCPIKGRLLLTINKTPQVTIGGNWLLKPGQSTTLRANSNLSGVTYDWYLGTNTTPESNHTDTLVVTAPTNSEQNIDVRLATTKSYGGNNNCVANNWITITTSFTGIDDVENVDVNIYPNPAARIVNLSGSEVLSQVVIYNAIGQQVLLRKGDSNTMQLDLGALATGQYTMRILTANGNEVNRKLIVSK